MQHLNYRSQGMGLEVSLHACKVKLQNQLKKMALSHSHWMSCGTPCSGVL